MCVQSHSSQFDELSWTLISKRKTVNTIVFLWVWQRDRNIFLKENCQYKRIPRRLTKKQKIRFCAHRFPINYRRCCRARLEKLHWAGVQLSEGLVLLGITGDQFMAPRTVTEHYRIEGFKEGGLNRSPIMPGDTSLSDSRCIFSQSGHLPRTATFQAGFFFLFCPRGVRIT